MAEHIGIVKTVENDRFALVVTDRKGACGGCESGPGDCRGCLANAKMESRVANPVMASKGDVVRVRLTSGRLFTGAAVLYLLPVFTLIFGAFAGTATAPFWGWSELPGALAGALTGLVLGYLLVIALDRNVNVRAHLTPQITEVLAPKTRGSETK